MKLTDEKIMREFIENIKSAEEEMEKRRKKFTERFNVNKIASMEMDEYLIGKSGDSFCSLLEKDLLRYGKMGKWVKYEPYVVWKGNENVEDFKKTRKCIIDLLIAAEKDDFADIENIELNYLFKSKLLAVYYPEKYLSILSPTHIDYFLDLLGIDKGNTKGVEEKRKMLLCYKENNPITKSWGNLSFVWYLYELRNDNESMKK